MDRIHDFVGTMKDDLRQEGIRKREELRPEHVEKYLEIKAITCSQNTINEYASELKKIGRLIGIDLQVEPVIAIRKKSDSRGAESVMSREDLGKILEYAREHPESGSSVAIRLEALIGVRVGDLAYGIRIDQGSCGSRARTEMVREDDHTGNPEDSRIGELSETDRRGSDQVPQRWVN